MLTLNETEARDLMERIFAEQEKIRRGGDLYYDLSPELREEIAKAGWLREVVGQGREGLTAFLRSLGQIS